MYSLPIGFEVKKRLTEQGETISWIHDVHEYAAGSTHMPELHRAYALELENQYLPHADHVLTVTEALKQRLESAYSLKTPVAVVHNSPLYPVDPTEKTIRSDVKTDNALAVYAGNVKLGRGVERFFPALVRFEGLHYAIVTNNKGPYIDEIKETAATLGIADRVHWLPYVPSAQVSAYLADADFGVLPFESYGNTEVSLPNKLFDYVFGGLPVISSNLEAISEFIATHPVGLTCNFDDPESVADSVLRITDIDVSNAKDDVVRSFRWQGQARTLAQIYALTDSSKAQLVFDGDRMQVESSNLRVLQCLTGAAGQPSVIAKALRKLPEIEARSLQITRSKFGYDTDYFFPVQSTQPDEMMKIFKSFTSGFDVFHFHFRPFFFSPVRAGFPIGYDLLALKALGKRVCVHFRGSEVRLRSRFLELNPYAYDIESDSETGAKFSEAAQIEYIKTVSAFADRVFVVDPELQTYVPHATIVERAIDLSEWRYVGVADRERPLIVHAPSRRGTKGTNQILSAVEELQAEGYEFDFTLVEGLTNQEARKVYESADIVIDQMRIGWHGVLSVEAMALGKAVICYIRDDLVHHLGEKPPLEVSNLDRLKTDLVKLITDKAYRMDLGRKAHDYCQRVHSADVIASKLAGIYQDISRENSLNADAVVDLILSDTGKMQSAERELNTLRNGVAPYAKSIKKLKASLGAVQSKAREAQELSSAREVKFRERIDTLNQAVTTLQTRVENLKAALSVAKQTPRGQIASR